MIFIYLITVLKLILMGFLFFIEIIDNNVFVTFALEYNENAFFSFFSALAPERTQGVIEHIFVYDNKLCLSCLLTNIDVFFSNEYFSTACADY